MNNIHLHNSTGQQSSVKSTQRNSSGGSDIVVQVGDAMAHNIRTGGTLSRANRDSFGLQRIPIQR